MKTLSGDKCYEAAAIVRDQVESLDKVTQVQQAVTPEGKDEDVVAISREGDRSCGVVLRIREGKLLGSESFIIPSGEDTSDGEIFDSFFELYYHSATGIPPLIITQRVLTDRELLERWFRERTGRRVVIVSPRKGAGKRLVELALRNAKFKILSEIKPLMTPTSLLGELKKTLGLISTPIRIEAYDVSNIHGYDAVGSMVVFENGKPLKSDYRRFKIREVGGIDDFAMLGEVLKRRFTRFKAGRDELPDLLLIDGGRGHVSTARKVLDGMEIHKISIIGLAKRQEDIHLEQVSEPVRLPRRSDILHFLQRIRNEAHRFAIEFHRNLRLKSIGRSALDDIPGIGEKRKALLLVEFGSIEGLKKARIEEIVSVQGIGEKIARTVYKYLHGE